MYTYKIISPVFLLFGLLFFFLVFVDDLAFASGSGTISNPYTTLAELTTVPCGNTVYLKSGTYSGQNDYTFSQKCTSATPLIVKCSNGSVESKGSCLIDNTSGLISGSYITIDGFDFTANSFSDIPLEIDGGGTNNTITDCRFTDIANGNGLTIGRTSNGNNDNTFTRCLFQGAWGGYVNRVRSSASAGINSNLRNKFTRNVYLNCGSSGPILQTGQGDSLSDDLHYYTEFTNNLVLNCNTNGSLNELLEIKSSNSKINYNTFKEAKGEISLRAGNNSEVIGNIMIDSTPNPNAFLTGIRVSGSGHKIINNYLEGYQATCSSGDYVFMGIDVFWGGPTCNGSGAAKVENALIANNTVRNTCGGFAMGQGFGDCSWAPTGVNYINNLGESNVTYAFTRPLFGNGDYSVPGNTWAYNLGHTSAGQDLVSSNVCSGSGCSHVVDDSGSYLLTKQKSGLTVNWFYPSTFLTGIANTDVATDINGYTRANPPSIGCVEKGSPDPPALAVGPSWTGGYTINNPLNGIIEYDSTPPAAPTGVSVQ